MAVLAHPAWNMHLVCCLWQDKEQREVISWWRSNNTVGRWQVWLALLTFSVLSLVTECEWFWFSGVQSSVEDSKSRFWLCIYQLLDTDGKTRHSNVVVWLKVLYSIAVSVSWLETLEITLSTVITIAEVHKKMPCFSFLYCFTAALELGESYLMIFRCRAMGFKVKVKVGQGQHSPP